MNFKKEEIEKHRDVDSMWIVIEHKGKVQLIVVLADRAELTIC